MIWGRFGRGPLLLERKAVTARDRDKRGWWSKKGGTPVRGEERKKEVGHLGEKRRKKLLGVIDIWAHYKQLLVVYVCSTRWEDQAG